MNLTNNPVTNLFIMRLFGRKKQEQQKKLQEQENKFQQLHQEKQRLQKLVEQENTAARLAATGTTQIIDLIKNAEFCYMQGDENMTFRKVFLGRPQQIEYYIDMSSGNVFSVHGNQYKQAYFRIPELQQRSVINALRDRRMQYAKHKKYIDGISKLPINIEYQKVR